MSGRVDDSMLGEEKIGKLLVKLSLPATIAMLVNGLYNLIDTIFVGQGVGIDAIGGLTISLPFQMIIIAIGGCFGIGAASVISRRLGEGKREAGYRAAGTALTVSIITGAVITFLGYLFLDDILIVFGATEGLIGYAREYLSVILIGNIFMIFSMTSNNIARSEGKAKVAMVSMLIGAVGNIILDPIFIFGFKMGIRGAAVATVIAQGISFLYLLRFFLSGRSSLKLKPSHLKIDWLNLKEILVLGVPALVRQGGMSFVMILVNNALAKYGGDLYISVYGVVMRILMFIFMPLLGIVQGFQPIAGYNYGAGKLDRVKEVLKKSLIVSTVVASLFFIFMYLFPETMFRMFTSDETLSEAGIPFLRAIILILPLLGLQVVGAQYFLAIGKALPSLFLSLSRQFIFLLPLIIILPLLWGLDGVMYAFPIADLLSSLVTGVWLLSALKSLRLKPPLVKEAG